MQDAGVNEQDAERAEASWYLSRDGEQHGPLSDRELSLFAEGGNFKPGDLLWTAGLDEWKPADAIFGLAPSDDAENGKAAQGNKSGGKDGVSGRAQPKGLAAQRGSTKPYDAGFEDAGLFDDHIGGEPLDGDHVGALAKALRGEAEPQKLSFQEQLTADIKSFAGFCAYLWGALILLTVHAIVVGAQHGVGVSFFLLTTFNAFVLMQALPRLERVRFFQSLTHRPLIYGTAYKTMIFVAGLVLMYTLEMGVLGFAGIGDGFSSLGGFSGLLAWWFVFSIALLPYFALREVEAAGGNDIIGKRLFGRH